jgi:dTDP-4-amino-4,6-dideoxygalactose transaminase
MNIQKNKKNQLALLGGRPILKKPFPSYHSLGKEEERAALKVMRTGIMSDFLGSYGSKFLGGQFVLQFEEAMKRMFKVKYAVSFNSASTALQAAVAALGIGPGDEIITSPYTMSATASAILLNNAIPVFADLDPDSFSLDAASIESKITPRTKAIMLVNIFGGASDFENILPLAKKYNLKIIEDNAQAIGAKFKNKFLGTIGDAGVFSFNVHKNLQCGEGGVLVTNDKKIAFRAQLVRNHGEVVMDEFCDAGGQFEPIVGSNYRLSEIHAAVALEQLKKIKILNGRRIELANYLSKKMREFEWLQPPKILKNTTHVYYFYVFKFFESKIGISRSLFRDAVAAEGFPIRCGYLKPLYLIRLYQKKKMFMNSTYPFDEKIYGSNIDYKAGLCPNVERLQEKELMLTTICHYPRTKKDIDGFVQAIEKVEKNVDMLIDYEKTAK